jgi:putative transposase
MDEPHLYVSLRYIELNPVRAGLAARAEDWRWSSARGHLGLAPDSLVDPGPVRARIEDWRSFLDAGLDDEEREIIRSAERTGRLP